MALYIRDLLLDGVKVYDAVSEKQVTVKGVLINNVNDLPGMQPGNKHSQYGSLLNACHQCAVQGYRFGYGGTVYPYCVSVLDANDPERGLYKGVHSKLSKLDGLSDKPPPFLKTAEFDRICQILASKGGEHSASGYFGEGRSESINDSLEFVFSNN